MPLSDDLRRSVEAYRAYLAGLGPEGRVDFVDAARRSEDWPIPTERYLAGHAVKWGRGKTGSQYGQWAYDIKNRAGVHVYAYIHPIHGNRGIAFVDLEQDAIVQFDCDVNQNFDCLTPPSGARRWIADKRALGTHWRLRDTER